MDDRIDWLVGTALHNPMRYGGVNVIVNDFLEGDQFVMKSGNEAVVSRGTYERLMTENLNRRTDGASITSSVSVTADPEFQSGAIDQAKMLEAMRKMRSLIDEKTIGALLGDQKPKADPEQEAMVADPAWGSF